MSEKVLFVDDEPQVLDGYRRQLGRKYRMEWPVEGRKRSSAFLPMGPSRSSFPT